jgi:hypothetical protein
MNDQAKIAFGSATEVVKSTLSLSTALLSLSVTFLKDLNKHPTEVSVYVLESSWAFLTLAAVLGVVTLMAITGTLARNQSLTEEGIYGGNIRLPMAAHLFCFLAGIVLTAAFGMLSV